MNLICSPQDLHVGATFVILSPRGGKVGCKVHGTKPRESFRCWLFARGQQCGHSCRSIRDGSLRSFHPPRQGQLPIKALTNALTQSIGDLSVNVGAQRSATVGFVERFGVPMNISVETCDGNKLSPKEKRPDSLVVVPQLIIERGNSTPHILNEPICEVVVVVQLLDEPNGVVEEGQIKRGFITVGIFG